MPQRIDMDEDRLPWLETVEPDYGPEGGGLGRAALLALLGVALAIGLGLGAYHLLLGGGADGDGRLIAAPAGDYKVRPDDPGGLKVEGEGDAAVATSQGKGSSEGSVDLAAVPEAPVAQPVAAPADRSPATPPPSARSVPTSTGGTASVAVPASGGRLVAARPLDPAVGRRGVPGATGGGTMVQLGAYPTEAAANAAWGTFATRFGYLAALGKTVQPVAVEGRTFYRLRVDAGSAPQAADIVGRLRVAGEDSFVAR